MRCATTALLFLGCANALLHIEGSPVKKDSSHLEPKPAASRLRASAGKTLAMNSTTDLHAIGGKSKGMPCQCDLGQPTWVRCARTVPKCVFIDLGAADGNTLKAFIANQYGPVHQCPSGGQWQATLVEANPRFDGALKTVQATFPGSVYAAASTAAYMCEAQTTFYLDTKNVDQNYWGSSMSANHVDAQASGHQAVTVPTLNILKLLYETTIPTDYVILKMDIEGSEWDVLPCLSQSNYVGLVDRLLVEMHPQSWGNAGTDQNTMNMAMQRLRQQGVEIPDQYHSQTF